MVKTKRQNIYPMTNEQMKLLISEQTIPKLKVAKWAAVQNGVIGQDGPRYFWKE